MKNKDYGISISRDGKKLLIAIPIERAYETIKPNCSAVDDSGNVQINSLTFRQREVFMAVREGLTAKEIGVKLNICTRTVKFHLGVIYARLGMQRDGILRNFGVTEQASVN